MECFVDDPHRGQITLTVIVLVVAAVGIWFGRRKLLVTIPVVLVLLYLAAIAIPGAIPARSASQRNACVFYLRAIQEAKAEWAKANNKLATDTPTEAELYGTNGTGGFLRHRPECPRGGIYTIGCVRQNPTCTYSNKGHFLQ